MASRDILEPEKGNVDPLNYHSPNMSADWRFSDANLMSTSVGLIPRCNSMTYFKGNLVESSSCSSVSMVDSFCTTIWDQSTHSQNLGICEINVPNSASTSNTLGIGRNGMGPLRTGGERTLGMGWTPNAMLKGKLCFYLIVRVAVVKTLFWRRCFMSCCYTASASAATV